MGTSQQARRFLPNYSTYRQAHAFARRELNHFLVLSRKNHILRGRELSCQGWGVVTSGNAAEGDSQDPQVAPTSCGYFGCDAKEADACRQQPGRQPPSLRECFPAVEGGWQGRLCRPHRFC